MMFDSPTPPLEQGDQKDTSNNINTEIHAPDEDPITMTESDPDVKPEAELSEAPAAASETAIPAADNAKITRKTVMMRELLYGMRTTRSIVWFIFGGWVLLFMYAAAGLALCATVVGLPFGLQCLRLAIFVMLPIGKQAKVIWSAEEGAELGFGRTLILFNTWESPIIWIANAVWSVSLGMLFLLVHLALALVNIVTVIGVGNALTHLKLGVVALAPFGRTVLGDDSLMHQWDKTQTMKDELKRQEEGQHVDAASEV